MALGRVLERFSDYVGEVEISASRSSLCLSARPLERRADALPRARAVPPASPPPLGAAPPAPQPQRLLLSCVASPRLARPENTHLHRVGVEVVLHRVGEDDAEGEEPGGTRIEVVGS